MDIGVNLMRIPLHSSIKLSYIIFPIVRPSVMYFLDLGIVCCSFVAANSIAFKIALGGFIGGSLLFVAPLYWMAINGRNGILSKTMPFGGLFMIGSWVALMFV